MNARPFTWFALGASVTSGFWAVKTGAYGWAIAHVVVVLWILAGIYAPKVRAGEAR